MYIIGFAVYHIIWYIAEVHNYFSTVRTSDELLLRILRGELLDERTDIMGLWYNVVGYLVTLKPINALVIKIK